MCPREAFTTHHRHSSGRRAVGFTAKQTVPIFVPTLCIERLVRASICLCQVIENKTRYQSGTIRQHGTLLIRNQQVAGSIPAGGSIFSITYALCFSHLSHVSRILSVNRAILRHLAKSAGRSVLAESVTYASYHCHLRESPAVFSARPSRGAPAELAGTENQK
jgi:hypothetical protein